MDITIPTIGESITEGTIAQWLKKDGDQVRAGEALFELETDKATTEIPSPGNGVLRIKMGNGKTVAVGAVVGAIEERAAPSAPARSPATKPVAAAEPARDKKPPERDRQVKPAVAEARPAARVEPPLSPSARRLARASKQAPAAAPAQSAPSAASSVPEPALPKSTRETRQPMSAIRQRIAERLLVSQKSTATLTTFNEADMSAIIDLRARHKDRFREKHGVGLGFMGFFVKAAVEALRAYPIVNAWIDKTEIVYHEYYNIGVAVSTEKGLMVPVVRDADRLSFAAIEKTIADMAEKARSGKISVPDLQGGTFTITNGGIFGSMLSTPILNPPQSAILGMHAIQKRAVVVNDQIVIRPMMYLALSYDHRLIDGRDAVLFLVRVKECIEQPERLLLEA